MNSVILEAGCFSSLVISAVEVYSKETTGLLIGKDDRRFIMGQLTDCVVVQTAYPLQTAWRGFASVMIGNIRAFRRARRTLDHLGYDLMGEYHSHPEGTAKLSAYDEDYIRDQLSERAKKELKSAKRRWLELIVGIKKRSYDREQKPGWYPILPRGSRSAKKIAGILKTTPDSGYYIEIRGYWIDLKTSEPTNVYYSSY